MKIYLYDFATQTDWESYQEDCGDCNDLSELAYVRAHVALSVTDALNTIINGIFNEDHDGKMVARFGNYKWKQCADFDNDYHLCLGDGTLYGIMNVREVELHV